MSCIPIIDISPLVRLEENNDDFSSHLQRDPQIKSVVDQISLACETFGFFAITNHGVDPNVMSKAWDASKDFFALDPVIKSSVPMSKDYPYGYENHESLGIELSARAAITGCTAVGDNSNPTLERKISALQSDSKETFAIGPIDSDKSGMPPRKFPPEAPSTFEPALTQYFAAMENLARILFQGLALALRLDDASWFLREGRFDDGHQCALRILNYPELVFEEEPIQSTSDGDDKLFNSKGSTISNKAFIRAGAHTDYGAMTILKSGGPGLQLRLSTTEARGDCSDEDPSSWIDVPHLSDAFIINLGDLMQRWTNDRWRSTLHRVVAVPSSGCDDVPDGSIDFYTRGNQSSDEAPKIWRSARRQSIAFFVNMNGNASIFPFDSCVDDDHPPRYDAIKASQYLIQRHAQSMGDRSQLLDGAK